MSPPCCLYTIPKLAQLESNQRPAAYQAAIPTNRDHGPMRAFPPSEDFTIQLPSCEMTPGVEPGFDALQAPTWPLGQVILVGHHGIEPRSPGLQPGAHPSELETQEWTLYRPRPQMATLFPNFF